MSLPSRHRRRVAGRTIGLASAVGILVLGLTACHGLLDVSDPTLLRDSDISNASGASGLLTGAATRFFQYVRNTDQDVGLFTDETRYDTRFASSYNDNKALDQRDGASYVSHHLQDDPHLGDLDYTITYSSIAIPKIRQYTPPELRGDYLGQLFAFRAYVILQMAEDICPGFPINDVTPDGGLLMSGPYTTDSAVAYAITQADSAIAEVTDSTQYGTLARIVKGRALLDLGQYSAAATAVTDVPSSFVFTGLSNYGQPFWLSLTASSTTTPVGDVEGGTGLAFVSEHDPRVSIRYAGKGQFNAADSNFARSLGASNNIPVTIATGIEARLIEAEAALQANDPSWLTTLNTLRATIGMAPLVDPGSMGARVDLLYHERAFWLYNTGRRLGDLRRLIRNYGRAPESVFPTGTYHLGGPYGTSTAIPFSVTDESQNNKQITAGCTVQ